MQKAYFKNVLSIIKKNKVSYIAIMMLIFLSTHIYLSTTYLIKDVYVSYDNCLDYCKKYDVAAYVADGTDSSVVDELSSISGTDEIETLYVSYGNILTEKGKISTEVITLSKDFVQPLELEGKLPVKKNEVGLLKHYAKSNNIKIGDKIVIEDNKYLYNDEFVVTALFESSQYANKSVSAYGVSKTTGSMIYCIAYVSKSALNSNYVTDNYVMMRNDKLRGLSRFSDEYKHICEDYIDKIDDVLDNICDGNYIIEKWNEDSGYDIADTYVYSTKAERRTLVPILIFVAIAVLISTISRMILDQKDEIGIMKANGFTDVEISSIFYIYSLSATIIGTFFGNVLATFLTEKIVLLYTSTFLTIKSKGFICDIVQVFYTFIVSIIVIIFTTYMCIRSILKKNSLDILNNKKSGSIKTYFYEALYVFKRLPIFIQMIINNMFKDAHRCIGIIFGIAGSVMLLSCGIIINRNIYDGYRYQIDKDILFDTIIFFDPKTYAKEEIKDKLSKHNINAALVKYTQLVFKNPENNPNIFSLFVYDEKKDFSNLFRLNTMEKMNQKYGGLLIQNSYKKNFSLSDRGYVKVKDNNGDYIFYRTSGYFYNYFITPIAIIDKDTYEDIYDNESFMNAYIIDTRNADKTKLYTELEDIDGYLSYYDYEKFLRDSFTVSYNFTNCVVLMFAITSIILSFLIVLSFMKVNIMERKSEFMILMINGFTKYEIKKYVLFDMIIMIIIGHVFGLIGGSCMSSVVLSSLISDTTLFMDKININAIIISLIVSFAICGVITRLSIKELDNLT